MTGLSPKAAAVAMGIGERTVWRLLKRGELQRVAGAPTVQVSEESINHYLAKKSTAILLPNQWNCQKDSEFNQDVARLLRSIPALSEPASAARKLGISRATLERLLDEGDVPVVQIGSARFVPAHWLSKVLASGYGLQQPSEGKA